MRRSDSKIEALFTYVAPESFVPKVPLLRAKERASAKQQRPWCNNCHEQRITLGRDKGYGTKYFVKELRELKIIHYVAQNTSNRRSAIDGRTTNHPNYPSARESGNGLKKASAG